MSTGASPDGLRGISSQELGASEINSSVFAKYSATQAAKSVYHFVQSLCRPELAMICAAVAVSLLLLRKKISYPVIWGISWTLCALRFYGQIRWFTSSEILLLVFTAGMVSALCSLAMKELADSLAIRQRK